MWPGPYGEWGSRKYLVASLDQTFKADETGLRGHLLFPPALTPTRLLEETMSALDFIRAQRAGVVRGYFQLSAGADRPGRAIASHAGHAVSHSSAVLQHVQPLDRRRAAGNTRAGRHRLHCVFAAGARLVDGQVPSRHSQRLPRFQTARFFAAGNVTPAKIARVKQLNELAKARGQTLAQMALAWVLRHPGMTSALVGASHVAQVRRCCRHIEPSDFGRRRTSED